jgi:hypothetical protein
MAGYQDLRVWQLGIEITKKVYQLTEGVREFTVSQ